MTTGRVTEPVTEPVFAHISVLRREMADWLCPEAGKRYLDGTLGGGGHSEEILMRSSPDGQVLGLDRDDEAIAAASQRLQHFGRGGCNDQCIACSDRQCCNEFCLRG